MKDYQLKKEKMYLLPETVYRQALWAVKDLPRLKEKMEQLDEELGNIRSSNLNIVVSGNRLVSDTTGKAASERAVISQRIKAIEDALAHLPEIYRDGILEKVAYGKTFSDEFHMNTWKRWQQVYIYWVAKNLLLY